MLFFVILFFSIVSHPYNKTHRKKRQAKIIIKKGHFSLTYRAILGFDFIRF